MERRRRRRRRRRGGSFNCSLGTVLRGPFSEKASQRIRNYTNTGPIPRAFRLFEGTKLIHLLWLQLE